MDTVPKYVFLGFCALVVAVLVGIGLATRGGPPPKPPLVGAGSSFVAPLMVQWSASYESAEGGRRINYRSLGSGEGIRLIVENRGIDFACSDAPLTDEQLARAAADGGAIVHVPLALGAVVPVYNLAGVADLRFTGPVLADIYLGKVKKWNDPALRELNPAAALPDRDIVVVHRSDGSGTTWIWADYLCKVSPSWKGQVGGGTDLRWPTGLAEPGNEGVSEKVRATRDSIGYVELTYAYRQDLAIGLVQNRTGRFVKASLPGIRSSAMDALKGVPDDLRLSLTDAPGAASYPIVGVTYALVRVKQPPGKGDQVKGFLSWATTTGQGQLEDLLYARLPESLAELTWKQIDRIGAE